MATTAKQQLDQVVRLAGASALTPAHHVLVRTFLNRFLARFPYHQQQAMDPVRYLVALTLVPGRALDAEAQRGVALVLGGRSGIPDPQPRPLSETGVAPMQLD